MLDGALPMVEKANKTRVANFKSFGLARALLPALVLAAGWIYWPALRAVLQSWEFDYDHGPVLLLIALFLFYKRWPKIVVADRGPAWIGVPGLLLAGCAWGMAYVASIQSVEMLLLPVIVAGIILVAMGWRSLLAASLPIAYLYFAMPVWGFLNPLLQALTVFATSQIVALISIPARISGNFVILPNGVFEIASGCSGLSYFISAAAIGVLYAGLYLDGVRRRFLMVAASLMLAVVANWIRVVLIIVAGYQTDMQHYLVAVDHYWFGWVIFGIFLVPLFLLGRRLEHPVEEPITDDQHKSPEPQQTPAGAVRQVRPAALALLLVGSLAAMSAAPLAAGAIGGATQPGLPLADHSKLEQLRLPAKVGDWKSASVLSGAWWPAFQNVQFSDSRSYQRGGLAIEAHWLVYLEQRQDAEAINAYNFFAERAVWRQQETWQEAIGGSSAATIPITEALITRSEGGRKRLTVTYYVAGELAGAGIDAKLAQIKGILRGRRDAAVLLLGVDCDSDCPNAVKAQHGLLTDLITPLQNRLDEVILDSNSQTAAVGSSE